MTGRFTRRDVLGGAVKARVAGGALALVSGSVLASCDSEASAGSDVVACTGRTQAGIVTPVQGRLVYVAFDLTTEKADDIRALLQRWTTAIAAMTAGRNIGPVEPADPLSAPVDTGEAVGSPAAHLTVTIGFGRSVFVTANGDDRFGLADRLPAPLAELPQLPNEAFDASRCGGDISVQCCADDPQTAFHAFHNLARIARGTAVVR